MHSRGKYLLYLSQKKSWEEKMKNICEDEHKQTDKEDKISQYDKLSTFSTNASTFCNSEPIPYLLSDSSMIPPTPSYNENLLPVSLDNPLKHFLDKFENPEHDLQVEESNIPPTPSYNENLLPVSFDNPLIQFLDKFENPEHDLQVEESNMRFWPNDALEAKWSSGVPDSHTLLCSEDNQEIIYIPQAVEPGVCNSTDSIVEIAGSSQTLESNVSLRKCSKPRRYCPFCGCSQVKLSRHIKLKHKNIKEVSEALKLPAKQRNHEFDKFRKQGILKFNKSLLEDSSLNVKNFQHERRDKSFKELFMCGNCNAFVSKKYIAVHQKKCVGKTNYIPVQYLKNIDSYIDSFEKEIISTLRNDEIGNSCKFDATILLIGKRLWMKGRNQVDKKENIRRMVTTNMRRLGSLYAKMKRHDTYQHFSSTAADIFARKNFNALENAIESLTQFGEGIDNMKYGLKTQLYYLLKKCSNIVKAQHLLNDDESSAKEVDNFVNVLELHYGCLFSDALYAMNKKRNENLRKPQSIPLSTDIDKIRDFILENFNTILCKPIDSNSFVELRDNVVSRLTLFNARRGGEPCRLLKTEWLEAEDGAWVNKENLKLDSLESHLVNTVKITYQTGKGNKHLVPILFPKDTLQPIRELMKYANRKVAGVNPDNRYVFPSTHNSLRHVSGWYSVHQIAMKAKLDNPHLITATKNRHRVSTLYASMELTEAERKYFYEHMGHSEFINKNVYQAPLAVMEITKVGRCLTEIDEGLANNNEKSKMRPPKHLFSASVNKESIRLNPSSCDDLDDSDFVPEKYVHSVHKISSRNEEMSTKRPIQSSGTDSDSEDDYRHSKRKLKNTKCRKYVQWKEEEKKLVLDHFKSFLDGKETTKLPSRIELQAFVVEHKFPHSWDRIRNQLYNHSQKEKNKKKRIEKSLGI